MSESESQTEGEYERSETSFRDWIQDETDAKFRPEGDRYHLYIARPCPWAHGAVLARELLGLQDVISMDVLDPYREARGWQFSPDRERCTADTVNDTDYLAEVYQKADESYSGHVSVPVLWDKERNTIVNNESIEIMKMLASAFDEYQTNDVDLYPSNQRDEIDRIVNDLYDAVNNGVYRAGFAKTQQAYDQAIDDLFEALDYWESVLADQRFLVGDQLTLADIRLFPTLVRFDHVYHTHFKCNVKRIVDYDHLWEYTKDIYQLEGVAETVIMEHIKEHYYTTHTDINPKQIVATGPNLDFDESHDRDRLPGNPPETLV